MPYFRGEFVAQRRDKNHKEICDYLRLNGYEVIETHSVGNGAPDAIVFETCPPWRAWPIEIKSRKGKLTPAETFFHAGWRGRPILVVRSPEQALMLIRTPER